MYLKSAVVLVTLATSYYLLVFGALSLWPSFLAASILGFSVALVGFNVQHDANHGGYSKYKWVNEVMGLSLDLVGGSSLLWKNKHNTMHHTYANITGQDDDINVGILGRLSPFQKRMFFHRYQHLYLWFFYGLLTVKWQLIDDFRDVILGQNAGHVFARPTGKRLVVFLTGKLCFVTLAFLIPSLYHPWWVVVGYYLAIAWFVGLLLSIVFQLAHVVEGAGFILPEPATGRMPTSWSIHQIKTTADFARNSRWVSWLLGGLNFQIEHHLFPRICHIHYPKLSRIVQKACTKTGIRYLEHTTCFQALGSHYRWLKQMGRPASPMV